MANAFESFRIDPTRQAGAHSASPPKRPPREAWKPPYHYKRLHSKNSTRLLTLYAGSYKDPLRGELDIVNLDTRPAYDAVSYVWGREKFVGAILIGGTKYSITANLTDALMHIRKRYINCVLWVDAICINQKDPLERNQQVKNMAFIFQRARQVLVYISAPNGIDIGLMFGNVERLCALESYRIDTLRSAKKIARKYKSEVPPYKVPGIIQELKKFARRRWFHRVWTAQEIGLASSAIILCGSASLSWQKFVKAHQIFYKGLTKHELWQYSFRPDQILFLQYRAQEEELSFLDVLAMTSSRGASNPRDRVFAMLSHPSARMPPGEELIVEANYNWSVRRVYQETAIGIIKQMCSLDILSYVWQDMKIRRTTPSWVPQWTYNQYANPLLGGAKSNRACGSMKLNLQTCFQKRRELLYVRGWAVGVVSMTLGPLSKFDLNSISFELIPLTVWLSGSKIPRTMTQVYSVLKRAVGSRYGDKFASAFGLTLTANRLDPQYDGGNGRAKYISDLATSLEQILRDSGFEDDLGSLPAGTKYGSTMDFTEAVRYACQGRKLFTTETGYMGLGPSFLMPGDIVCVLHGGQVPYILRRAGRGNDYRLVGECHIQGLMEGQAEYHWLNRDRSDNCGRWEVKEFVLH